MHGHKNVARLASCHSIVLLWTPQEGGLVTGAPPTVWIATDLHLVQGCFLLFFFFFKPQMIRHKVSKSKQFTSHAILFFLLFKSPLFLQGRYGPAWCSFLICMISCSCARGVMKVVFSARAAEHQVGVRIKRGEALSTEVHCCAGIVCDVAQQMMNHGYCQGRFFLSAHMEEVGLKSHMMPSPSALM